MFADTAGAEVVLSAAEFCRVSHGGALGYRLWVARHMAVGAMLVVSVGLTMTVSAVWSVPSVTYSVITGLRCLRLRPAS